VQHSVRVRVVGLAAVALTAAGCGGGVENTPSAATGGAFAGSSTAPTGPGGTTTSPGEPEISAQEAQAIALEVVGGGWILKTQTEDRDDVLVTWEVTVVAPTGQQRKVTVDITNGSVVGDELED